MKLHCPVLAVLIVLALGAVTGVAIETNNPSVSKLGDKYLCEKCTPK